jgi:hypothetical protein
MRNHSGAFDGLPGCAHRYGKRYGSHISVVYLEILQCRHGKTMKLRIVPVSSIPHQFETHFFGTSALSCAIHRRGETMDFTPIPKIKLCRSMGSDIVADVIGPVCENREYDSTAFQYNHPLTTSKSMFSRSAFLHRGLGHQHTRLDDEDSASVYCVPYHV